MSKCTPGPWKLTKDTEGYDTLIEGPDRKLVADCWPDLASDAVGLDICGAEQAAANTRLLLAAPDMLDGLQAVLEILRNGQEVDAINDAHWIEMLIEKATGETP